MKPGNVCKLASNIAVKRQLHRRLLTCPLCLERYRSPKLLPCFHTFCELCLYEYIPAESLTSTCPVCRHQSILPRDGGIAGLQDNVFIISLMDVMDKQTLCAYCEKVRALSRCIDCDVLLCDSCISVHGHSAPSAAHHVITFSDVTHPIMTSVATVSGDAEETVCGLRCASHDGQKLSFYCIDCETAVCQECTYMEHVSHQTVVLCNAMDSQRQMLTALLDGVDEYVETLKRTLATVRELSDDIRSNYSEVTGQIRDSFEALAEEVRRRKDTLLAELETTHADRQLSLARQADCLENLLVDVTNCCELTQSALRHGNETEVLLVRKEMTEKLARLKDIPTPEPLATGALQFTFDNSVLTGVTRYLRTIDGASQCVGSDASAVTVSATGDGLCRCTVLQPTVVLLTTRDSTGQLVSVGQTAFSTRLTTTNGGERNGGSDSGEIVCFPEVVHKDAVGLYELIYVISTPGRYRLDIRLRGRHVPGSPFLVTCTASVPSSPPKPQSNTTDLARQRSTTKARAPVTRQLPVPSGAGTKRPASSPPCNRSSSQPRSRPSPAAVTPPTRVRAGPGRRPQPSCRPRTSAEAVGSSTVTRPVRITSSPRVTRPSVRPAAAMDLSNDVEDRLPGARTDKQDPTIDPVGSIVTGSPGSGLVLRVGRQGRDRGEFINPQGICYSDADGGLVLVADSYCACVQAFSAVTGQFRFRFGRKGHLPGQLMRPTGIGVTSSGNFVVADYENSSLNVFSPTGQYVSQLTNGAQLVGPKGVCAECDGQGRVAVVDNKDCGVVIYGADGRQIGKFGTRGSGIGNSHLFGPQYCAFIPGHFAGQSASVVVSDFRNNTVKVIEVEDGQLKFSFGSYGDGNGQFNGPTGVAVDSAGNILVADWKNARIQVFDERGSFVTLVDTSADPLYGPQGLAVSSRQDLVIVADSGNHCFKIFRHPLAA